MSEVVQFLVPFLQSHVHDSFDNDVVQSNTDRLLSGNLVIVFENRNSNVRTFGIF